MAYVRPRLVLALHSRGRLSDLPAFPPRSMRRSERQRRCLLEIAELRTTLDLYSKALRVLATRKSSRPIPPELAPANIEVCSICHLAPSNVCHQPVVPRSVRRARRPRACSEAHASTSERRKRRWPPNT